MGISKVHPRRELWLCYYRGRTFFSATSCPLAPLTLVFSGLYYRRSAFSNLSSTWQARPAPVTQLQLNSRTRLFIYLFILASAAPPQHTVSSTARAKRARRVRTDQHQCVYGVSACSYS